MVGAAVQGTITADVYLQTADDNLGGQYKIFVDDFPIDDTVPPGASIAANQCFRLDGIQTDINFRDNTFSSPIQPTRRLIGTLKIDHIFDPGVVQGSVPSGCSSQIYGTETIYMSLLHSGPTVQNVQDNFGDLKLDALILVLR